MKIIDKTPLQNDKGEINIIGRIQGSLKYGFDWYAELEAQKNLIAQLNRSLEKGFVLIRNFNLPGSAIFIPLILIGTGGIYVIYATSAKGNFEAKGDQWNVVDNSGNSQPARDNLLDKAVKLTRAFQKFLEINKIKITAPIETVLIAVDPGAHIETSRPIIKVIKSDVIKVFIASLQQAVPVWRADYLYDLADRIVEPRLREAEPEPAPAEPEPSYQAFANFEDSAPQQAFDAADFRDSFGGEAEAQDQPTPTLSATAERPHPKARPRPASSKKILGMSRAQVFILAGIFLLWLCIMAVMGAILFL